MAEVSTSILSIKDLKTIYNLEVAKTNYYHIDVMDGKFVKNNTTEKMLEYVTNIKHASNLPIDVHLMVQDVEKYISDYLDFKPNIITFHYEETKNKEVIMERIKKIKENGARVGLSIKPKTPVNEILEFLPYIHVVLIMTVEPGEGGQKLIPETIEKVKEISKYIEENAIDIDIEVDGGVNLENVEQLKEAGATIIVAGTAIIESEDYSDTIKRMK